MTRTMRILLTTLAAAALATGGTEAALHLRTIHLKPGHCTTIHKASLRVCANRAEARTVVSTLTIPADTVTVTTAPPPSQPLHYTGTGDSTLPPFTLTQPATLIWQNNGPGVLYIQGPNGLDTGGHAQSGQTWMPAGTYVGVTVISGAGWVLDIR